MNRISIILRAVLIAAVLALSGGTLAAPGDILFSDGFERANLAPWTTTNANASGIMNADSMLITDVVPPGTALFVDTSGGDPIVFSDGGTSSGLVYDYATGVSFSNQPGGGPPFNYTPVPDAAGFDPAISGFQIAFSNAMNAASAGNTPGFDLQFQLRVQ